jgi:hypothetical protein
VLTQNRKRKVKVVTVYAEVSKNIVLDRLATGQITGCGPVVPPLTIENVEASPTIVAQMGPEPILEAMTANPDFDILIAGRAYDPAPYIAYCAFQALKSSPGTFESLGGSLLGCFTHMGKIMECGALCATPKGRGAVATIYTDGTFNIKPTDSKARCTPLSVAAHTLYEKTRPDLLYGPGGWLDLTATKYEQLEDDVSIRVRGGNFNFTTDTGSPYTVKLEAARLVGYRTIFIGSFSDPILMSQIESYLETGKEYVGKQFAESAGKWKLHWHVTGLEEKASNPKFVPKKITVVGEVLADTQDLANGVANIARVYCVHGPYEGQKATSGNFAMGIGGNLDLPMGECAEFSIYHLMDVSPGEETSREVKEGHVLQTENGRAMFSWKKILVGDAAHLDRRTPIPRVKVPLKIQHPHPIETSHKKPSIPSSPRTVQDIAKVIRSKNAGPFELTIDIMFEDVSVYQAVKNSNLLGPETVKELYKLGSVDEIVWCGFFDQALAFKVTLPRTRDGRVVPSGGFMEDDVHGSQHYMPFMELPLGDKLVKELEGLS